MWVSQSGELSRSYSHRDVAGWGAEMVAAVPALARAGAIIGAQADPYRAPGGQPDPAHDLRSQIVNLACEVELLRANGFDEPDVLEAIHKQASYRFSPQLVSALVPLLEERHRD